MRKNHSIRILEILDEEGPQTFGELQEKLDTSASAVSYALRKKLPSLVERGLADRKYRITEAGRFVRHNSQLMREVDQGAKTVYKEKSAILADAVDSTPFLEQYSKVPLDVGFIGDGDLNFQKILDKIWKSTLKYLPSELIYTLAEEVGRQRGFLSPPELEFPPRICKKLLWIKKAYDFEITLMLHLNPKKVIRSIDWPRTLEKGRENDKHLMKSLQIAAENMLEAFRANKNETLAHYVTQELEFATQGKKLVLGGFVGRSLEKGHPVARSEDELLRKMVKEIQDHLFVKEVVTEEEIRDLLIKMLKQEFRIASTTLYYVEKNA